MAFCPKESFAKAAMAGGLAAAGAMVLGESLNSSVSFFGLSMPAPLAVGAAVAGGSLASDVSMPLVSRVTGAYIPYGELGTGTLISGASTALILQRVPGAAPGSWVASSLLGAGSFAVADNITHRMYGEPAMNSCAW